MKLGLLDIDNGEIIRAIQDNETFSIRTKKQQEHDKMWSEETDTTKGDFMKQFIDNNDILIKKLIKTSPTTYCVLMIMAKYLEPKTNALIKGKKKLKVVDIAEELNISQPSASEHIKKLRELNIIADMEEYNIGKCMHINPYYMVKSKTIYKRTVELFDQKEMEKAKENAKDL